MYGKDKGNGNGKRHGNGSGNGHGQNPPPERQLVGKPLPLPPLPGNGGELERSTPAPAALTLKPASAITPQSSALVYPELEQEVVLRQSPRWSRWILWGIVGVVTFGVAWACIAEIEQVAEATGQLKPEQTVKEVQAPVDGVVQAVLVEEGDTVEVGDVLMKFDSTNAGAELQSSLAVKKSLEEETKLYRSLLESDDPQAMQSAIATLELPENIQGLTQNRRELLAENRLYQAQLAGGGEGLNAAEQARLNTANTELQSRQAAAQLEIEQLQRNLSQTESQLSNARSTLDTAARNLTQIQDRNRVAIANAVEALTLEQGVLNEMAPVAEAGAIAQVQFAQQKQTVNERRTDLDELRRNANIEEAEQRQRIADAQSEIRQLEEELRRIRLDIAQGREELTNTTVGTQKDVRDAIATNTKRLAEIDSQLSQAVLEVVVNNEKQLQELESKISQLRQTLEYQEVRATVSGTIFDLQAYNGFVARPSDALVSIVPQDNLIAEVFVTNQDIGFVQANQAADVRIDSFPFSEFSDIKGEVVSVSSDALPPDEVYQYFRFPVKVRLNDQVLRYEGREIPLQSGMSVSVNIKIREDRKVISLFIEMFDKQIDTLKKVR
jgi:HlyD family secretion protein